MNMDLLMAPSIPSAPSIPAKEEKKMEMPMAKPMPMPMKESIKDAKMAIPTSLSRPV
jgi:hypothetical protein